jgi:hypothetical protein
MKDEKGSEGIQLIHHLQFGGDAALAQLAAFRPFAFIIHPS